MTNDSMRHEMVSVRGLPGNAEKVLQRMSISFSWACDLRNNGDHFDETKSYLGPWTSLLYGKITHFYALFMATP